MGSEIFPSISHHPTWEANERIKLPNYLPKKMPGAASAIRVRGTAVGGLHQASFLGGVLCACVNWDCQKLCCDCLHLRSYLAGIP